MRGYKNIVFDIGNVLIRYDPIGFLERSPYAEQKNEYIRHIFDAEWWVELDKGTIDEETVFRHLYEQFPDLREGISYISNHWINEVFSLIEGTSQILTELKEAGYRIYLLSNFGERGFQKVSKEYAFFEKVDGKIVSYDVKTVKPEREIYDLLLERYDLAPHETIYIDERTVDVHVRRLRAKLGLEYEALIGTVRNVGYRFIEDAVPVAVEPAPQA